MKTFEQLGLSKDLLDIIRKLGIKTPTEIQEKAIPAVINGQDVIGESATGSGKTLVFGSGIAERISHGKGIQALVLTPTRELAEQVKTMVGKLSRVLKVAAVYGGVSMNPQISNFKVADVVVATPGRLLDHMNQGNVDLSHVKLLVLDEADRMLDMGFIDDVEKIIRQVPAKRQTLFFSATISGDIKRLSNRYMKDPVQASAANQVDPSKLKQYYYDVPKNMKISLLVHLLNEERSKLVMIFCNTRRNVDFVVKNLRANKINAIAIHGGLSQNKRSNVMGLFNQGKAGALVCTDVAARGLHIDNVSHIYNFDIPKDTKDYVHRIGRTARAGEEGKAINLLSEYDHDNFRRIGAEYRDFSIEFLEMPDVPKVFTIKPEERRGGFRPHQGGHGRRNFGFHGSRRRE